MTEELKIFLALALIEYWVSGNFNSLYYDWDMEEHKKTIINVSKKEDWKDGVHHLLLEWGDFCKFASEYFIEIMIGNTSLEKLYKDYKKEKEK